MDKCHIDTVSIVGPMTDKQLDLVRVDPQLAAEHLAFALWGKWLVNFVPAGRINGYQNAYKLVLDGCQLGHVAFGGNRNKAGRDTWQIHLTGVGCAVFHSQCGRWSRVARVVEEQKFRVTRVDLALDDLDGNYSILRAVEMYRAGEFSGQGRPPSCAVAGDWINEHDKNGRTFYVGKRGNAKMLRVYEKGKQLGDSESRWVRWEIELRAVDYVIPANVLRQPMRYVVGAYKAFALLADVAAARGAAIQKSAEIAYQSLLEHARRAYGRLVHVISQLGEDVAEVLTEGVPAEPPRRLVMVSLVAGASPR